MREILRCPKCGLQAEVVWGDKDIPEESYVWWLESDKSELIYEPIICPKDGAKMRVVRACPTCIGRSEWLTTVTSAECDCPDCKGAGEILEEQHEHEG